LKRFDLYESCPKCGSEQTKVCWVPYEQPHKNFMPGLGGPAVYPAIEEHLMVSCSYCGFQWNRAPLDADDEVPEF
jgi:hypothetical protein